jgi:hypothetical protein
MRGVQALDAAFNDDANMADYAARFHPNHPVGRVGRDFITNYAQITPMMRVNVPVMLFIDRKGVIRAQYFGGDPFFTPESALKDRIKAELDKLLQDDKPAGKKSRKPR